MPDDVVRSADQIELVDMSPEALRRRMAHGNVYAAEKVDAALANYFRPGNLSALRELALLWLADRVDEALSATASGTASPSLGDPRARRRRPHRRRRGRDRPAPGGPIAARGAAASCSACTSRSADGLADADPALSRSSAGSSRSWAAPSTRSPATTSPTAILDFARGVNATQIVIGARRGVRAGRSSPAAR